MNPTKTSFVTAMGVTLAALSVVYGSYVRESLDMGRPLDRSLSQSASLGGLEVSRNQIPEDDFFRGLVWLLEREYVEPITDERKLAVGAVKGMVGSLKDPRSQFMDADEFRVFNNATAGRYEGIGVDMAFDRGHKTQGADEMTPAQSEALSFPRLKVIGVTPGGPADKAGVKPGDWVESVENHWVLNPEPFQRFRNAVQSANAGANKGLSPKEIKERQDAVRQIGSSLKAKLDTMIMPAKARDLLTIGSAGSLNIVWHRGDALRPTTIVRKESEVPMVQANGNTVTLRFATGAAEKLRNAITRKNNITIDLRNNSNGDFRSMLQCLAVVAPAGTYGTIESDKSGKERKLVLANGNNQPPKMTLLVDSTTRAAADIFATALASKKLASLNGTSAKDLSVVEVVSLPDGSGYTLVTGVYTAQDNPAKKKVAIRTKEKPTSVAMREYDGSIIAMSDKGGNA